MATSSSRDFIMTRNRIITRALARCGIIDRGNDPSSEEISDASEVLNSMVSSWQNDGIYLWTASEDLQLLTDGTASYTLDADIVEITNPILRKNDSDTPINMITRDEYYNLATKKSEGGTNQLWFDPQLAAPVIKLWPVPSNTTSVVTGTDSNDYLCIKDHTAAASTNKPITGSSYTTNWASTTETGSAWASGTAYKSDVLRFTKVQRLQDFDNGTDNPDFPVRWYEALISGLAVKLGIEDSQPRTKMVELRSDFAIEFGRAKDGGNFENADTLTIESATVRL